MANALKVGETRIGHLIDGEEQTPWLACSLSFDPTLGSVLKIPFVYGEPQFRVVEGWTDDHSSVPASLIFRDDRGGVAVTGLRYHSTGDEPTNMLPGLASQLSPHAGPGPSKMTERSARCFEQTSYPAATVFSLNSCGGPDKVAFAAAP